MENVLKTCAHPPNASSAAGIVQFLSNRQQESAVCSPNCISPASSVSFRSPIKASLLVTPVGYLICPKGSFSPMSSVLNVVKALFHVYEGSISSPLIF